MASSAYDNRTEEERMAAADQWDNTPAPGNTQQRSNEALRARLDPAHPNYIGPGYAAFTDDQGRLSLRLVDPEKQALWKEQSAGNDSQTQATQQARDQFAGVPSVTDYTPPTPQTELERLQQAVSGLPAGGLGGGYGAAVLANRPRQAVSGVPTVNPALFPTLSGSSNSPPTIAGGPPEVDRSRIDPLLSKVNQATSGLLGIAQNQDEYSAAQAQLALGLEQAQRNALSVARSGNRRDRAAMQARALQTNAEQSAEATRSAALLRAQEEDANQRLRMDAYKAAGDLGLNSSALEVDVNRLNMDAVTSYLNQVFETNRTGMVLDQKEAERVTNAVRDMALIGVELQKLDQAGRDMVLDHIAQMHGIDEQSRVALKALDKQPGFWENMALGVLDAGAQVGAGFATKSDRRAKREIADATDAELEALLGAVGAKTFKYKRSRDGDGDNFGVMAQDLRKTKFGKSLTFDDKDGEISVNNGKAGLAALAGLSMVYQKLKELEESL